MDERLQRHGNLQRLIREEAERWGWSARFEHEDRDPAARPWPRDEPGRCDVVLSKDAGSVAFEYHLPESPSDIVKTIRSLTRADELEAGYHPDGTVSPVRHLGGV